MESEALKIKNWSHKLLQKRKTKSNEVINEKWSQKLLKMKNWSKKILQQIKNWSQKDSEENVKLITYRNIQDLRAVGIRLKPSSTQRPTDIDFSAGWFAAELILPKIVVEENSTATFLNLIAYEMSLDFQDYGICSFVAFIDSLIDHPEDVKELRSKGILLNCLGSDEEVSNLFNNIATHVVSNPKTYRKVRYEIHEHYLSNLWAIIAFLAAFIALALTFIQTWFMISPTS